MRRMCIFVVVVLAGCSTGELERGSVSTTTSPPPSSASDEPLSGFVAFGDFGGGNAQYAVAAAMQRWVDEGRRVDALVTTGDNVYDEARPELFAAQLDEPYRALRATRPLWVTLGNHDVAAGYGDEELAYLGLPELPFTKELPGAQLLFLDGNEANHSQAQWLAERLSEVLPGDPFRIVIFHQPAYSCGSHGSTPDIVARWVPVIEQHAVSLVLNGHDHDFQRFRSDAGVTYVVTGGGGRDLYPIMPFCRGVPSRQASALRHHFVGVEIRADSLTLTAVAEDSTVLDRAELAR